MKETPTSKAVHKWLHKRINKREESMTLVSDQCFDLNTRWHYKEMYRKQLPLYRLVAEALVDHTHLDRFSITHREDELTLFAETARTEWHGHAEASNILNTKLN